MLPRSPRPTRFPYTTLFRSTAEQARDAVRESGVFAHNAINHAHWGQRLTSAKEEERNAGRKNIEHCLRVSHAIGGSAVDRKSTRLNSSHRCISYAVFCLKKK